MPGVVAPLKNRSMPIYVTGISEYAAYKDQLLPPVESGMSMLVPAAFPLFTHPDPFCT
jgi:hypothetical protein